MQQFTHDSSTEKKTAAGKKTVKIMKKPLRIIKYEKMDCQDYIYNVWRVVIVSKHYRRTSN